jgi:hypothetical protein
MSSETERLQIELDTLRRTNVFYAEQLRTRDLAEADKNTPAEINYALRSAQRRADEWLENPEAMEELRAAAWLDFSLTPEEGNLYRSRPPSDGSWPPEMSAESYVRKFHGLNESADALAGETPPEPEEIKLSPWLEAAIAKAKGN